MQLHTCIYIKSKQSIPDRLSSKMILKNECEQWDSNSQPHEPDKNEFVIDILILNRSRHWKDVRGRLILKNQKSLKWVSFHYLNCLILYECIKINIVKEMSKNQSVILFHVIIIRILISYLRKTLKLLVLLKDQNLKYVYVFSRLFNIKKYELAPLSHVHI